MGAAGLYPSVAVGASANFSRTMPQGSDAEDYSTLSVQPSLELSWTLFGGFRVWRTKAKLDAAQEQAEGSQTVLIENMVRSIISAYYQAVLESEKVTIAQQLMDASMDRFRREQHAADLGVVRNLELLQAKNAWLQDRASYLSQKNNYEDARRQLGFLLAVERGGDWTLTDSIPGDRRAARSGPNCTGSRKATMLRSANSMLLSGFAPRRRSSPVRIIIRV